jgi:methyl-accepting chemotaxis protein
MSLFQRILLAPAIATLLMLALGAVGYHSLNSQNRAVDDLYNVRTRHLQAAGETRAAVLDVHSRAYRLMTWAGTFDASRLEKDGQILAADMDRAIAAFSKWNGSPSLVEEERQLGARIDAMIAKYKKSVLQAIDMASVDMNTGLAAMQTADDNFSQLGKLVDELVRVEEQLGKRAYDEAAESYQRTLVIAVIVLFASIGLAAGLSLLMARRTAASIAIATGVAARVAEGDLDSPIPAGGADEIGQLLNALRRMQENLREAIGAIGASAKDLQRAASVMSESSSEISHSVHEQSESITSTAAAVEEMTVSIAHVSENAGAARNLAEQTVTTANNGKRMAGSAAGEINKIAASVGVTSEAIRQLQESSQAISNIANVIRDIADQTNLLALNAAIEAARAGEQGRGFAVVADEVRKLAEKTGMATSEIKAMIETIHAQTSDAATRMSDASEQVTMGVRMIRELQDPLQELSEGAGRALESLTDLSAAAREQSNASTQIAQNVERIAQMAEKNGESVARSHEIAQGLSTMSDSLLMLMGKLKR